MRFLIWLKVVFERAHHRMGHVDLPKFALIFEAALCLPDLEHDIEGFTGHITVLALHSVYAEQLPVTRQAARSDAEHVAPLCQMVHEGYSAGEFCRMMIRQ